MRMMMFNELSFICRSLFGIWALTLCCVNILGLFLAAVLKKCSYVFLSLPACLASFIIWQTGIYLFRRESAGMTVFPGNVPWLIWFSAMMVLTVVSILPIWYGIKRARTMITPMAIKLCSDEMDCGICYWRENGRVIFANNRMNELCMAITSGPLLNGNRFKEAVGEGTVTEGGRTWNFAFRDLLFEGSLLHEMIASDVTEIHAKTERLKEDNLVLAAQREELMEYSYRIDETVRHQEILQAKISIHDEMNRLILETAAAEAEHAEELQRILAKWETNALLLGREAEGQKDETLIKEIHTLAQTLKVHLKWPDAIPAVFSEKQKELFFLAAQEAVVNAVKHGEASELRISAEETPEGIRCCFENDGGAGHGEVHFTGGLANLALLAEERNAQISVETGETFRLILDFHKLQ